MHFTEKSTFWTKICLLIQCILLLDGVWISFYRNEKKINAFFCIKVHFSIINLCKQSPMGNKNESFIILLRKRKREKKSLLLSSKAGSTTLSMPKFEWQKKVEKICHLALDIMPKSLHNILRVTLVSTGLVRLLLLAKHRSLLSVWSLLRRLIVRSFFTTPSNVCWYVSSSNLSSMYQITLGRGSPETIRK